MSPTSPWSFDLQGKECLLRAALAYVVAIEARIDTSRLTVVGRDTEKPCGRLPECGRRDRSDNDVHGAASQAIVSRAHVIRNPNFDEIHRAAGAREIEGGIESVLRHAAWERTREVNRCTVIERSDQLYLVGLASRRC